MMIPPLVVYADKGNQSRGMYILPPFKKNTFLHRHRSLADLRFVPLLSNIYIHTSYYIYTTMAVIQKSPKGASVEEEKKKLLQQYKNDDGHFSLVR